MREELMRFYRRTSLTIAQKIMPRGYEIYSFGKSFIANQTICSMPRIKEKLYNWIMQDHTLAQEPLPHHKYIHSISDICPGDENFFRKSKILTVWPILQNPNTKTPSGVIKSKIFVNPSLFTSTLYSVSLLYAQGQRTFCLMIIMTMPRTRTPVLWSWNFDRYYLVQ